MNPLPPLPLVEGRFLVDNSALETLVCPRQYEYQNIRKRVLNEAKAGRNFGSTLHAGWAVRYRQCGSKAVEDRVVPLINEAMQSWLESNPQPMEDFRSYSHACAVMAAYNGHYQDEPFKILADAHGQPLVESSFALPFGTVAGHEVYYTGKLDLGIEDPNGIWSHDHKTTFQFGDSWEASMATDKGQLGYTWALHQVLPPGTPVMGYVIDGVRIRRPKKSDEYTGTAPVDASDFIRLPHHVSDDNLEEWRETTIHQIEEIFYWHAKGHFRREYSQCVRKFGKCDFYDVCTVSRANRADVLASPLFEDNLWTPLKQPES